ncbi:MAG TPA: hypothetical protein DDX92_07505 [Flavobacteriales bacterium]|nr:hypothetical protein [Flavobacteriales bacterium]
MQINLRNIAFTQLYIRPYHPDLQKLILIWSTALCLIVLIFKFIQQFTPVLQNLIMKLHREMELLYKTW